MLHSENGGKLNTVCVNYSQWAVTTTADTATACVTLTLCALQLQCLLYVITVISACYYKNK